MMTTYTHKGTYGIRYIKQHTKAVSEGMWGSSRQSKQLPQGDVMGCTHSQVHTHSYIHRDSIAPTLTTERFVAAACRALLLRLLVLVGASAVLIQPSEAPGS